MRPGPLRSCFVRPLNSELSSTSDLRIPSRVASAQKALRERVGVVREFSKKVEGERRSLLSSASSPGRC